MSGGEPKDGGEGDGQYQGMFIKANIKVYLWLSNPKGTLVYTKQMQTLKADFWKEGVGGSKKILKKILKKITNYEEQHVNLDEEGNKKLGKRFRRLGKGEINEWGDNLHNICISRLFPTCPDQKCLVSLHIKTHFFYLT